MSTLSAGYVANINVASKHGRIAPKPQAAAKSRRHRLRHLLMQESVAGILEL